MTTKTNDLMEKLRVELPKKKANKSTKPRTSEASDNGGGDLERLSITVRAADLKRLNQIKRVMLDEDVRMVSDSLAIRLAVRTVALDPKLLREAYDAMLSEDKRRA